MTIDPKLFEGATPGPWLWRQKSGTLHRPGEPPYSYGACVLDVNYEYDTGVVVTVSEADAALIAHAPQIEAERVRLVALVAELEGALGETRKFLATRVEASRLDEATNAVDRLEVRMTAMVEALTPSAETKCAYIGEFSFSIQVGNDDDFEASHKVTVPWDVTKKIMAAIRARAALGPTP